MSMTSGLIAIKGEHLDKLPEILAFYQMVDTKENQSVDDWREALAIVTDLQAPAPGDTSEKHVVWSDKGWTLIEDMTLIMCANEKALSEISRHLSTPVLSLVTQGTSNCFGFWYFDNIKRRSFYIEDRAIVDNFGEPLPEEAGFNFNEDAFYHDVHGVAKAFGVDWEGAGTLYAFTVKRLDYKEEVRQGMLAAIAKHAAAKAEEKKKPWWKIWT
ncbi:MAG TPA: hypothetical protein VHC48_22365 [Puia sp.]|nr:hypothetical protein [Puia sp.]